MIKGILLAAALAWLAVASPNVSVDSTPTSHSMVADPIHESKAVSTAPVPEPSTLISFIFGVGLLSGVLLRLRSSR